MVYKERRKNQQKRGLTLAFERHCNATLSTTFPKVGARVNLVWISPSLRTRGRFTKLRPLLPLLISLGISGCANPGPPKPPSLNLPVPVKDLQAERVGDHVQLTWTTPSQTTDDIPVKPPLSAEICREVGNAGSLAACTTIQRLAVRPGPGAAADPLPAPLLTGPIELLRYRIRILNAAAHAADPSNVAFTAAGAAPAPVSGLRSEPAPAGTRILWQPDNAPTAEVMLQRITVASAAGAAAAAPAAPVRSATGPANHRSQTSPMLVRLQASPTGSDHGGTVDISGQRDVTYSYIAWRTRSVLIHGRSVTLRSQDSPPLIVTIHDTTPPPPPTGLEAIVDNGSVDLSWEPDTDADLAGYWVERADVSAAPSGSEAWKRVNQTPLSAPAYRDAPGSASRHLRYRILAVDTTGNLSQPTPPVSAEIKGHPAP